MEMTRERPRAARKKPQRQAQRSAQQQQPSAVPDTAAAPAVMAPVCVADHAVRSAPPADATDARLAAVQAPAATAQTAAVDDAAVISPRATDRLEQSSPASEPAQTEAPALLVPFVDAASDDTVGTDHLASANGSVEERPVEMLPEQLVRADALPPQPQVATEEAGVRPADAVAAVSGTEPSVQLEYAQLSEAMAAVQAAFDEASAPSRVNLIGAAARVANEPAVAAAADTWDAIDREMATLRPIPAERLSEYYTNKFLQNNRAFVQHFIQRQATRPQDELYVLISQYQQARIQLMDVQAETEKVWRDAEEESLRAWRPQVRMFRAAGQCKCGRAVTAEKQQEVLEYEPERAQVVAEKLAAVRVARGEKVSRFMHEVTRLAMRVSCFLDDFLSASPVFQPLDAHSPVTFWLQRPAGYDADTMRLLSHLDVVFWYLRNAQAGTDREFADVVRVWVEQLLSALLRVATFDDHRYILHHLIRVPNMHEWGAKYVQFPQESEWNDDTVDHFAVMLHTLLHPENVMDMPPLVRASAPADSWVIVDDLCDAIVGRVLPSALLSDDDFVALVEQFPFARLFSYIMKVHALPDGTIVHDPGSQPFTVMLQLFCFARKLMEMLVSVFERITVVSHEGFLKRIGSIIVQLVQFIAVHWMAFREAVPEHARNSHGLASANAVTFAQLNLEFDQLCLEALKCLLAARGLNVWQFLASIPFAAASPEFLWRAFFALYTSVARLTSATRGGDGGDGVPGPGATEACAETDWSSHEFIELSLRAHCAAMSTAPEPRNAAALSEFRWRIVQLHPHFVSALLVLSNREREFLLTALANLVTAPCLRAERRDATPALSVLAELIANELFELVLVRHSTAVQCEKTVRNLLASIAKAHPRVISILLQSCASNFSPSDSALLSLFAALPLHQWRPSADDMKTLHELLWKPLGSHEQLFAQYVLKHLQWGYELNEAHGSRVLPVQYHWSTAVAIVQAYKLHVGLSMETTASAGAIVLHYTEQVFQQITRPKLMRQRAAFQKWAWSLILQLQLRLHAALDDADSAVQPMDPAVDPLAVSLPPAQVCSLSAYTILQTCSAGYSGAAFCSGGAAALAQLLRDAQYKAVLRTLLELLPQVILGQEDAILQCPEMRAALGTLLRCGPNTVATAAAEAPRSLQSMGESSAPCDRQSPSALLCAVALAHVVEAYPPRPVTLPVDQWALFWSRAVCCHDDWPVLPIARGVVDSVFHGLLYLCVDAMNPASETQESPSVYLEAVRAVMRRLREEYERLLQLREASDRKGESSAFGTIYRLLRMTRSTPWPASVLYAPSRHAGYAATTEDFRSSALLDLAHPYLLFHLLCLETILERDTRRTIARRMLDAPAEPLEAPVISKDLPWPLEALSVYRWAHACLHVPADCPLLPLYWQMFFAMYFANTENDAIGRIGEPPAYYGHLFFRGERTAILGLLQQRLAGLVGIHQAATNRATAPEATAVGDAVDAGSWGALAALSPAAHGNLAQLYAAFRRWLTEHRLLTWDYPIASLAAPFLTERLASISRFDLARPLDGILWYDIVRDCGGCAQMRASIEHHLRDLASATDACAWSADWADRVGISTGRAAVGAGRVPAADSVPAMPPSGVAHLFRSQRYVGVAPPPYVPVKPIISASAIGEALHVRDAFDMVAPDWAVLQTAAQHFASGLARVAILDSEYTRELLPKRYVREDAQQQYELECGRRTSEGRCRGAGTVMLSYVVTQPSEAVIRRIGENRSQTVRAYDDLLAMLNDSAFCAATIRIELLVAALANTVTRLRKSASALPATAHLLDRMCDSGERLFYHIVRDVDGDLGKFTVLAPVMDSLIQQLGGACIAQSPGKAQRLLAFLRARPLLVDRLDRFFAPCLSHDHAVAMYDDVSRLGSTLKPAAVYRLLACFHFDGWLHSLAVSDSMRVHLIDVISTAMHALGPAPDGSWTGVVEVHEANMRLLCSFDFPTFLEKTLDAMLAASTDGQMPVRCWQAVLCTFVPSVRCRPDDASTVGDGHRCDGRTLALALTSDVALRLLARLGTHFADLRRSRGSLFTKWRAYVPLLGELFDCLAAFLLAPLASPTVAADLQRVQAMWNSILHLYSSWLSCSRANDPWSSDAADTASARVMVDHWVSALTAFDQAYPHRAYVLQCTLRVLADESFLPHAPSFVLSIIYARLLERLPWASLPVDMPVLTALSSLLRTPVIDTVQFVCSLLVHLGWPDAASATGAMRAMRDAATAGQFASAALSVLASLVSDRRSMQFQDLIVFLSSRVPYFDFWQHLSADSYGSIIGQHTERIIATPDCLYRLESHLYQLRCLFRSAGRLPEEAPAGEDNLNDASFVRTTGAKLIHYITFVVQHFSGDMVVDAAVYRQATVDLFSAITLTIACAADAADDGSPLLDWLIPALTKCLMLFNRSGGRKESLQALHSAFSGFIHEHPVVALPTLSACAALHDVRDWASLAERCIECHATTMPRSDSIWVQIAERMVVPELTYREFLHSCVAQSDFLVLFVHSQQLRNKSPVPGAHIRQLLSWAVDTPVPDCQYERKAVLLWAHALVMLERHGADTIEPGVLRDMLMRLVKKLHDLSQDNVPADSFMGVLPIFSHKSPFSPEFRLFCRALCAYLARRIPQSSVPMQFATPTAVPSREAERYMSDLRATLQHRDYAHLSMIGKDVCETIQSPASSNAPRTMEPLLHFLVDNLFPNTYLIVM